MDKKSKSNDSNRRRFIRTVATVGAAGGVAALMSGAVTEKPLIPLAQAASGGALIINAVNDGESGTTELHSTNVGVPGPPTSGYAYGVFLGHDTATSGYAYGLMGVSDSTPGRGVRGWATAQSGGIGVHGRSDSMDGLGAYGYASALSGPTAGVTGEAESPDGLGVYGFCDATSGNATGVWGESYSPDGTAVGGRAYATTGYGTGVWGRADSPDGTGVGGRAAATTGYGTGVWGRADSPDGLGAGGQTNATTGYGTGVFGRSKSPDGTGVVGVSVASGAGMGVFYSGYGAGVYGESDAYNGTGVYGYAAATSGNNTGVYGESQSPFGVGVVGADFATDYGNAGVYGTTRLGAGVQGDASEGNGIGVLGRAVGPSVVPIVAWATSGHTAPLQMWVNDDSQLAVVDKDGRLGLGTDSPLVPLHIKSASSNPALRIENENSHVGEFIYCYSNGNIPFFSGRRARGTIASPSAVLADDTLMRYGGSGYGSTGFPGGNRAILEFRAAEAWTDGAQGTYIILSTTPTGSTGTAERMRITSDGSILPPSDNTGSIGKQGQRWNLVRAQTVTSGDLVYENGVRSSEDGDGIAFYNPQGTKIALLDAQGNLRVRGKVIEGL